MTSLEDLTGTYANCKVIRDVKIKRHCWSTRKRYYEDSPKNWHHNVWESFHRKDLLRSFPKNVGYLGNGRRRWVTLLIPYLLNISVSIDLFQMGKVFSIVRFWGDSYLGSNKVRRNSLLLSIDETSISCGLKTLTKRSHYLWSTLLRIVNTTRDSHCLSRVLNCILFPLVWLVIFLGLVTEVERKRFSKRLWSWFLWVGKYYGKQVRSELVT